MREVINCYKTDNPVINKKLKEVSVEEGLSIATELFQILNKRKEGLGGLIKWELMHKWPCQCSWTGTHQSEDCIKGKSDYLLWSCLSYPSKGVSTQRYRDVVIETAQSDSGWYFSGAEQPKDSKGSWEVDDKKNDTELRLLESICVQHEIDHLNGITIHDRKVDVTYKAEKKIGRNELVTIKKGDAVKVLKYKKAQKFLNDNWILG